MQYYLVVLYRDCSNYALAVKGGPARQLFGFIKCYIEKNLNIYFVKNNKTLGFDDWYTTSPSYPLLDF